MTNTEIIELAIRAGLIDRNSGETAQAVDVIIDEIYPRDGKPFSCYVPNPIKELDYGYTVEPLVGTILGEPWYSNGHVAVIGSATGRNQKMAGLELMINPSDPVIYPVAFWNTGSYIYVLMSDGSALNADYFDFLMGRFPDAQIRRAPSLTVRNGDLGAQAQFYVGGKCVAVCMPIHIHEANLIPDGLKGLIQIPQKEEAA